MNQREKAVLENICKMLSTLPDNKRECIMGVAAAMVSAPPAAQQPRTGI